MQLGGHFTYMTNYGMTTSVANCQLRRKVSWCHISIKVYAVDRQKVAKCFESN